MSSPTQAPTKQINHNLLKSFVLRQLNVEMLSFIEINGSSHDLNEQKAATAVYVWIVKSRLSESFVYLCIEIYYVCTNWYK